MLDCLIIGDSIAVGTQMFDKQCAVIAKGGINSYQWVNKNIDKAPYQAKTVIISLGTNDHQYVKTEEELKTIRKLTKADRVYWILPAIKPHIQEIVRKVALEYGDTVLPIRNLQPDKIHPSWAGYKDIVEKTK
jgi:ABC-type Zn2+ transport system substrate-binding protein/surface adhesin